MRTTQRKNDRGRGRSNTGGQVLKVPDGFKPFRDVSVPARSVRCPSCDAEPGEMCIGVTTGRVCQSCHTSRRRMAIRKMREG